MGGGDLCPWCGFCALACLKLREARAGVFLCALLDLYSGPVFLYPRSCCQPLPPEPGRPPHLVSPSRNHFSVHVCVATTSRDLVTRIKSLPCLKPLRAPELTRYFWVCLVLLFVLYSCSLLRPNHGSTSRSPALAAPLLLPPPHSAAEPARGVSAGPGRGQGRGAWCCCRAP